jgi:hypothetical protein
MSVLIIGDAERLQIAKLKAEASANPVRFEVVRQGAVGDTAVLHLKDRKPGIERPPSAHMTFPGGHYRAAYSVEEQPVGFCAHLSISVARKGKMPSLEAVQMIAEEFGMAFPSDKVWSEEFEPGQYAVNLLCVIEERETGTA